MTNTNANHTNINIDNKINQWLEAMTTEEKVHLLNGGSSFSSYAIEHLGIPRIQYLDGGTGMNWEQLMSDWMDVDTGTIREVLSHFNEPDVLSETHKKVREEFIELLSSHGCRNEQPGCYPPGILLGATWNPETVYACGKALGQEALDYHVDILLGTPNVNLHRDPLNGRFFEGYSEDPCLITTLAPELVIGVQESGVLANVKHFAANNLEAYRQGVDEHISERALEELYLPGFRACVERGQVKTLMTAYNKINGVACTENKHLLQETLRKEWGFGDNLIISDWGAVYNQPEAIASGNDVDMPGPRDQSPVLTALQNGSLSEDDLNTAVRHMLRAILQAPVSNPTTTSSDTPEHAQTDAETNRDFQRKAAYDAITEGAVLLKNNDSTLPMKTGSRIAILGNTSAHFHDCGDGSARVYTNKTTSLLDELSSDTNYQCHYFDSITDGDLSGFDYAVITVFVQGQEGRDRASLFLSSKQQEEITNAIRIAKQSHTRIILLLNVCGPVDLRFCEQDLDAILCIFFPGMEGGRGVKDLLTGKVNPSGKLPVTFPKRIEDCPTYLNPPSPDWTLNYGEGIYVGYRYYDKKDIAPLYPFGYGLSYTSFQVSNIHLECEDKLSMSEEIRIRCQITNTGSFTGKEVLQLYVEDVVATLDKPLRELKAFQKIELEPGETKTVQFRLPVQTLASYDPSFHEWAVEPGEYRFYIGQSSRQLQEPIAVTVTGHSQYDFQSTTPFIRILEHPTAYKQLLDYCAGIGITESDFQGFAVYTPYFDMERVLNSVVGWRLKGDALEHAKNEIYGMLKEITI